MRTLTAPGHRADASRWIWSVTGLITAAALAVPCARLITHAGDSGGGQPLTMVQLRTVTVTQPVTSLSVESYGAPIQVTTGAAGRVTVTEAVSYYGKIGYAGKDGPASAVTSAVSHGRLTLAAPECAVYGCDVGFTVTLPPGVSVTADSEGGGITVSGAAGANLDSGGGEVTATRISGPLTVSAGGGSVVVTGLTGELEADSGGGPLSASGITGDNATISTEGGPAWLAFAGAPRAVVVWTDGGSASLKVPGGPYALTTATDGGSQQVAVATAPGAGRSLNLSTGGGPLSVEPAG